MILHVSLAQRFGVGEFRREREVWFVSNRLVHIGSEGYFCELENVDVHHKECSTEGAEITNNASHLTLYI